METRHRSVIGKVVSGISRSDGVVFACVVVAVMGVAARGRVLWVEGGEVRRRAVGFRSRPLQTWK